MLKEYYSVHEDCRVPTDYDHGCTELPAKLHNWVTVQKSIVPVKAEKGHPVFIERKKLLDTIDFHYE